MKRIGLTLALIMAGSIFAAAGAAGDSPQLSFFEAGTGRWTVGESRFFFGDPGDLPMYCDWDGDGVATPGLYRESTGFLYLRNTNTGGVADISIFFGIPGDRPVCGDWNGDGIETIGIFRPSDRTFYLRNTNTQGVADRSIRLAGRGSQPFAMDYDGTGVDRVGLRHTATGAITVAGRRGRVVHESFFGGTGDRILVDDWDGDGRDSFAVVRGSRLLAAADAFDPAETAEIPIARAAGTPVAAAGPSANAGPTVIEVYAAGATGSEQMNLLIDDAVVATFDNVGGDPAGRSFERFTYTSPDPVHASTVKVAFTNDGGARDLWVDRVTIGGVDFQSEDPSTWAEGVYDGSSCVAGNLQTELLACNGHFLYWEPPWDEPPPTPLPSPDPPAPDPDPKPAPTSTPDGVVLRPGDNLAQASQNHPPYTTFILKPGVYWNQDVTPKDGQRFIGEPGARLDGGRALTNWQYDGSRWYVTGQTQQGKVHGRCQESGNRCNYSEDLFVDGKPFQHVTGHGQLGPGKWFFDYGADRIYVGEDVRNRSVITSVTSQAFHGSAANVVIEGLAIQHYANHAQLGVIDSRRNNGGGFGRDWVVRNNEIRRSHAVAIVLTDGGRAVRNNVHHMGQQGIGGEGYGLVIEYNEIAYNNTARFALDWQGGGTKFSYTDGLVLRGNNAHHNFGPGLWSDIDNINTIYEDNTASWNFREGIAHEISYAAIIRNNHVEGNGFDDPRSWIWGSGIQVSGSGNVEVYGNTVVNNAHGIALIQQNRGSGAYGPYEVRNVSVHDNYIAHHSGFSGMVQDVGNKGVYNRNNTWFNNTYAGDPNARTFRWDDRELNFWEFQGYGPVGNGSVFK